METNAKQEATKNFKKVTDYIMESTKREMAKSVQDGGYLDRSLTAVVALYDIEEELDSIITAFELIDADREKLKIHDWMMQDFRDGGKPSGYNLKDFKKLSKDQLARIAKLQSDMIYVMADWGYYNSDKEQRLKEIQKELEEIYNEA